MWPGLDQLPLRVAEWIDSQPSGFSLPGEFYWHPAVHRLDIERIWHRHWLFAVPGCQLPHPGNYRTLHVGGEPILLVRGEDGQVRAFGNVCRHRGTILCSEEAGHVGRITCPYHRWSYGLDGRLLSSPGMIEMAEGAEANLLPVATREVAGLVYICLADTPPDFRHAERMIAPELGLHGLAGAKVAHVIDYTIRANWKVVFENNRECYHCQANHPEFCAATYDVLRDQPALQRELAERLHQVGRNREAAGLPAGALNYSSDMNGSWYRANRTPLRQGFVTESLDGKPVAPLLGSFRQHDVGVCRVTTFPNFWCHACCDHAVMTQLLPLNEQTTQARVSWLVHADAVAGVDYTLERLLPFWQRTSEQDWPLCERQQEGVSSRFYQPGRYSANLEANVAHFVAWYLAALRCEPPGRCQASRTGDRSCTHPVDS